jgi:hypothetical protein
MMSPKEIVRISEKNAEAMRVYRECNNLLGNFTKAVHEDMAESEPKAVFPMGFIMGFAIGIVFMFIFYTAILLLLG